MSVDTSSHHSTSNKHSTLNSVSKSHQVSHSIQPALQPAEIRKLIQKTLRNKLETKKYEIDKIQSLTKDVAEKIKNEVKSKLKEPYKVVAQMMIGQNSDQGFRVVNKCFWDQKRDFAFSENFMNDSLFAVCLVYLFKVY